jgi:hypothetical protein
MLKRTGRTANPSAAVLGKTFGNALAITGLGLVGAAIVQSAGVHRKRAGRGHNEHENKTLYE